MKIKIPGWYIAVSLQPKSKWGYFSFWHDGPLRAFWLGRICFEWWWR